MKKIKKFAVFLIFVLLINNVVYAETTGKEFSLSGSKIVITIEYQTGDEEWAGETLNSVYDILRLTENVSGMPYPAQASSDPYSDVEDVKVNIKICEFTSNIQECEKGFGISKDQDITITVRQIVSIWNTKSYFKNDWLTQGHNSVYSYLVLNEINQTAAENFKKSLFLNYNTINVDFPLDDWLYLDSVESERHVNKRNAGIDKSFIFMHLIYKNYGNAAISDARKILNKRGTAPDSMEYKAVLENVTCKNLDDMFSGWVFTGEYKIQHEESKEVQKALQKYNEVLKLYGEDPMLWVSPEELNEYKVCVKARAHPESCKLETSPELMMLYTELYNKSNIKESIKYSDELIEKYTTIRNNKIAEEEKNKSSVNETLKRIQEDPMTQASTDRYNEAKKLYDGRGIFTKIGSVFYNPQKNIDQAKTELDGGNFAGAKEYSERAISDLDKANKFGMVVSGVILLIFIVVLTALFFRR